MAAKLVKVKKAPPAPDDGTPLSPELKEIIKQYATLSKQQFDRYINDLSEASTVEEVDKVLTRPQPDQWVDEEYQIQQLWEQLYEAIYLPRLQSLTNQDHL